MQAQLVLPNNYVELEQEEMMYLDGGFYVDDNTLRGICYSLGVSAASSIPAIVAALQFGSMTFSTTLAGVPGGNIIALIGSAYILANVSGIASEVSSAFIRRKGMDITVGWWFAVPKINFSAR